MFEKYKNIFSLETIVIIKVLFATSFWAGTYIGGKIASAYITPAVFGLLRFVVASIVLLWICKQRNENITIDKKNYIPLLLLALTGCVFFNLLLQLGLQSVTAVRASLIATTPPLFITISAIFLFKERINGFQFVGVILSMIGAIIVISEGHIISIFSVITVGDSYVLLSMLSWVVYVLLGKKLVKDISPLATTTWIAIISSIAFTPIAIYELLYKENIFNMQVFFTCIYVGLFGTALAFVWFADGLKVIGAARSSAFLNIEAVLAVILAIVILGESISFAVAIGGIIASIGIYMTNSSIDNINFLKKYMRIQ